MNRTTETYLVAVEKHTQFGTTSLLPTTPTSTNEELHHTFAVYRETKKQNKVGSAFLGIHLECPYLSGSLKGSQDSRYLKKPIFTDYNTITGWSDDIIRWSIAPELIKGALEFGNFLKRKGILAPIAHSDAVHNQVLDAFDVGYTHITKRGPQELRTAMVQCVLGMVRCKRKPERYRLMVQYRAMKSYKRSDASIIAIARKLSTIMYTMLKRREPFDPLRMEYQKKYLDMQAAAFSAAEKLHIC